MTMVKAVPDRLFRKKILPPYTYTRGQCRVAYQHKDPRFESQCYIDRDGQPRDCASICLRGSKDFHETFCALYCEFRLYSYLYRF